MKNFTFLWVAILGFATAMQGQRITDLHTFSMMPAGLSDAEATMQCVERANQPWKWHNVEEAPFSFTRILPMVSTEQRHRRMDS
jgi:hypothetical protein